MIKMNKSERKYLKNSYLKSYLLHVEFEVLNILSTIKLNETIKKVYSNIGYDVKQLEITINNFLIKLRQLQNIFNY